MTNHILSNHDYEILKAAKELLRKIKNSDLLDSSEKKNILHDIEEALQVLPSLFKRQWTQLTLTGPKRTFGDHVIKHYWEFTLHDDGCFDITSGGYFSSSSNGGDSFSSMMWEAVPGKEPVFTDFLPRIKMVDDADTFENEIKQIDLNIELYRLDVESTG